MLVIKVYNRHTAPLHLPHALNGQHPSTGIMLAPGENTVDADYLYALEGHPVIDEWTKSGLLEFDLSDLQDTDAPVPAERNERAPEPSEPVRAPEPAALPPVIIPDAPAASTSNGEGLPPLDAPHTTDEEE